MSRVGMLAAMSCVVALAGCAAPVSITARMNGAQEVPPNATQGTGTLTGKFWPSTRAIDYSVAYSGLTGPATMAHFHGPAVPGQNAPVVVPFNVSPSPINGSATLTSDQAADLMAGKWYANIHTAANPGGEIRGQVMH